MICARRICRRSWARFVVATLAATLAACYPAGSKPDVAGVYELRVDAQTITLVLSPNGSFTETILLAGGRADKREGRWTWGSGRIGLDGLSIPKSFAPAYILRADSGSGGEQPRYTEPGYWSLAPEKHWGTMVLPVFPDANVYFEMVRHLK